MDNSEASEPDEGISRDEAPADRMLSDKTARVERAEGILGYVDGILRHREDYFTDIFENKDVARQIVWLLGIIIVLSGFHGLVMGTSSGVLQMLASAVKVPILFVLTLVVCYPVLYVVNVIMGSRLGFLQTLALILLAVALNARASCATLSSTTSDPLSQTATASSNRASRVRDPMGKSVSTVKVFRR